MYNSKVNISVSILFVFGSFASIYYMYNLAGTLTNNLQSLNLSDLNEVKSELFMIDLLYGATIGVGLIMVVLQLVSIQNKKSEALHIVHGNDDEKTDIDFNTSVDDPVESKDKVLELIRNIIDSESGKKEIYSKSLSELCKSLEACQGAIYLSVNIKKKRYIELYSSYAYNLPESKTVKFEFGEGLVGQVANDVKLVNLNAVPDGYIQVLSGLGNSTPNNLIIAPIFKNDILSGVLEIASFREFNKKDESIIVQTCAILSNQSESQNGKEKVLEENIN